MFVYVVNWFIEILKFGIIFNIRDNVGCEFFVYFKLLRFFFLLFNGYFWKYFFVIVIFVYWFWIVKCFDKVLV